MKFSLRNRLYFGFSIALGLCLFVGIFSYNTFQRQAKEADWVKHTYQVLNQIEMVQKYLVDMETGRRGFRSTKQRIYLQPYYTGLSRIDPALTQLHGLLDDNDVQVQNLTVLENKVERITTFWRNRGEDAAILSLDSLQRTTAMEKEYMDDIRVTTNAMVNSERSLLRKREQASRDYLNFATTQAIVGTIMILLIIIALIRVIVREFNTREAAEGQLQDNLGELKKLNEQADARNWLLAGLASVNDSMQGVADVHGLSRNVVDAITQYTRVAAGALYTYHEEKKRLELVASMALPDEAPKEYGLGEGLVGAAAMQRNVRIVNNVPADYWQVESGSGAAQPGSIICVPLWYNKELKGVLELATFDEITPQQNYLFEQASNGIAVSINAAESREKVMRLLEQVQEQHEVLQNQQEELRQSNEELTRQAEVLQASEEELKVQEEELRQTNAELEERNEAMEMARQALIQKAQELEITSKYKSEFLANMSHELRTPLNSVLILAKLLSENKQSTLTDKQVEYANVIHKSGSDLLTLINDILDLSKIEAGKVIFNFEDVTLKGIADDIKQLFEVQADEKGINFDTIVTEDLIENIHTDKDRLEQIIKNLLSNAFKFTPKHGTVTFSISLASPAVSPRFDQIANGGSVLAFAVKDSGIGIPPEKQQLIFEAFQQVDGSTSRKYGGTGLGLSISKELVHKLGGEIVLQSEEGKGSTFTILLPVAGAGVVPIVTSPLPRLEQKVDIPSLEKVTEQTRLADDRNILKTGDRVMLIIEDDPHFAAIVQEFARNKNYKTVVALQGDEGLLYARKYKPSAIILDMQLPVVDGWTLLKLLKSDPVLQKIPVHIISAADEAKLSVGGALAFLKKPLEKEDLEGAFDLIGQHLNAKMKKVLVLSGEYLKADSLRRFIDERSFEMDVDYVERLSDILSKLDDANYDSVIVDLGKDATRRLNELQDIRAAINIKSIPLIVYLDSALNSFDELQLKKLADVIIQDSSQSKERLMDELELFLYKVQEANTKNLPRSQTPVVDQGALEGKKVLLVDDDMRNVFALSTLLEQQQMEVITAGDGREALDMLEQHSDVDIVLMDVMMPEMDGYEATRRIRADMRFKKLPVIALTAKAMAGDREKTIESGASDYITKPVDSARLFSLIRVWLSQ